MYERTPSPEIMNHFSSLCFGWCLDVDQKLTPTKFSFNLKIILFIWCLYINLIIISTSGIYSVWANLLFTLLFDEVFKWFLRFTFSMIHCSELRKKEFLWFKYSLFWDPTIFEWTVISWWDSTVFLVLFQKNSSLLPTHFLLKLSINSEFLWKLAVFPADR